MKKIQIIIGVLLVCVSGNISGLAHDEMPPGYEGWGIPGEVEKQYEERIELQSFEQRPLIESIAEASKITGIPEDIIAAVVGEKKGTISWEKSNSHAESLDTYGPFTFPTYYVQYLLKEYPEYFTEVGLWYGENHHQAVIGQAIFLKEKKEALFGEKNELTIAEWRNVIYETYIEKFSYYFNQKSDAPGEGDLLFANRYADRGIALLQSENGTIELPDNTIYILKKDQLDFPQPHGSTEPVGQSLAGSYSLQSILSTDGDSDAPETLYLTLHADRYTTATNTNYEDLHSVVIHAIGAGDFDNIVRSSNQNSGAGTGAHFYINDYTGEITQMGDTKDYVHHAGDPRTDARVNLNKRSIGIEHEGNAGDQDMEYSNTQYKASAKLVRYLSGKYNIPRKYHGKYDETTTTDWWSTVENPGILGHMQVPGCKYNGGGATCKIDPDGSNFSGQSLWDWPYYISLIEPKHIAVQVNGYDLGDEGNIEFSKFKAEDSETFTFSITNTGRTVTPRTGDAETYSGAIIIREIDTENIKTQTGGEIIISNFSETLLQKGESASFSLVVKNGNSENLFESGSVMFSYTVEGENVPYYFRTSLTPKKIFSPAIISSLKGVKIRKSYSTNAQEEQPTWYTIEERGVTLDFIEKNKAPEQEHDWYEVYWIKGDTQGWSADLGEDRFKVEEYLDRDIGLIGADQKEYRSLFLKEYFKNNEKNIQIGDPFDDGSSKYLHEWDGVWLQNFSFGEGKKSVMMLSRDKTRAHYLPEDTWNVYAKNGPNIVGFPMSEEENGRQNFTNGYIENGIFYKEENILSAKIFSDLVPQDWEKEYVDFVSRRNIVKGDNGKTTFRPRDGVSRAELLKMAYVSAKGNTLPEGNCETKSVFSDVSQDQWYCAYIEYVEKNGILTVSSEGETFRPNEKATRGEAAYIISKLFGVKEENGTYSQGKKNIALESKTIVFTDVPDANRYSTFIHWMANVTVPSHSELSQSSKSRIVKGYSRKDEEGNSLITGEFAPENGVTRGEMSKIIAGVYVFGLANFEIQGFEMFGFSQREDADKDHITTSIGNLYEQIFDPANQTAPNSLNLTNQNTKIIGSDGKQKDVNFDAVIEEDTQDQTAIPEKKLEIQTLPPITENLNIPLKIKLPLGVPVEIEEGNTLSTKGFVNDVEISGGGTLEITGDLSVGEVYAPESIVILNGVNQYFSSKITAKKVIFRNPNSGSNPQKIQKFLGQSCEIFADVEIEHNVRVRNKTGESGKCRIHGNLVNNGRIYVDTGITLQSVAQTPALEIVVYGTIENQAEGSMENITLGFAGAVENTGIIADVTPVLVFEDAKDREVMMSEYIDFSDEETAQVQKISGNSFVLPKNALANGLQIRIRENTLAWSEPITVQKESLKKRSEEKQENAPEIEQEDTEEKSPQDEVLATNPVKRAQKRGGGGGVSQSQRNIYKKNVTTAKKAQTALKENATIFKNHKRFSDVSENHIHKKSIDFVQERGLVNGYADGSFQPQNPITRAEFTKIFLLAKYSTQEIARTPKSYFSDVKDDEWYASYVNFAKGENILNGFADGAFAPEKKITFAESAKILVNTLVEPTADAAGDEWWISYMQKLSDRGVRAYPPDHVLTRGEMTTLMYDLLHSE